MSTIVFIFNSRSFTRARLVSWRPCSSWRRCCCRPKTFRPFQLLQRQQRHLQSKSPERESPQPTWLVHMPFNQRQCSISHPKTENTQSRESVTVQLVSNFNSFPTYKWQYIFLSGRIQSSQTADQSYMYINPFGDIISKIYLQVFVSRKIQLDRICNIVFDRQLHNMLQCTKRYKMIFFVNLMALSVGEAIGEESKNNN